MIDYDEYECGRCGRSGVLPDGGFDYICPGCDFEGTLGEPVDDEEEDNEDEDEDEAR